MKQAILEAEDDAIYRSYIPFVAFQWVRMCQFRRIHWVAISKVTANSQ
jgi:hypothetical protein